VRKLYRCESCGYVGDSEMGYCPKCGRDCLMYIEVRCPCCKEDLGEGSKDEVNRISWVCGSCGIKIYKEMYDDY